VGITKLWTLEELLLDKNPLVRLPHAVASMPLRIITYDIELLQSPPLAVAAQGPGNRGGERGGREREKERERERESAESGERERGLIYTHTHTHTH
jgi:hypothetical protein